MPFAGHLNPMTSLARNLPSRGHDIAFIGVPDVESFARAANLRFVSFSEYPVDSVAKLYASLSKLHGLEAARQSVYDKNAGLFTAASKHLSRKLAQTGVEALMIGVIWSASSRRRSWNGVCRGIDLVVAQAIEAGDHKRGGRMMAGLGFGLS